MTDDRLNFLRAAIETALTASGGSSLQLATMLDGLKESAARGLQGVVNSTGVTKDNVEMFLTFILIVEGHKALWHELDNMTTEATHGSN